MTITITENDAVRNIRAYIADAVTYFSEAVAIGDVETAERWRINRVAAEIELAREIKVLEDAAWINTHHLRQALERQLAAEARIEGQIASIDREVAGGCRTIARWKQLVKERAALATELAAICS
jgi:hypothetical protein